jgi:hypothetical protein
MNRPIAFRVCLLGFVLTPALIMLGAAAQAQPPDSGIRFEKVWRCGKCNGYLGNSVAPPTYCHHCKSNLRGTQSDWMSGPAPSSPSFSSSSRSKSADSTKGSTPLGTIAVVGMVILAAAGLALYVFNSSNSEPGLGGRR